MLIVQSPLLNFLLIPCLSVSLVGGKPPSPARLYWNTCLLFFYSVHLAWSERRRLIPRPQLPRSLSDPLPATSTHHTRHPDEISHEPTGHRSQRPQPPVVCLQELAPPLALSHAAALSICCSSAQRRCTCRRPWYARTGAGAAARPLPRRHATVKHRIGVARSVQRRVSASCRSTCANALTTRGTHSSAIAMEIVNSVSFSSIGVGRIIINKTVMVGSQPGIGWKLRRTCCEYSPGTSRKKQEKYEQQLQNVDLPELHPKNKKKPFPVPIKKMLQASRRDKRLAQMHIEKRLEPPKNGLLVPELVPVAHEVLDNWKVLIRGLSELLNVVTVYGCRKCPQVHVGPVGHQIQDCYGSGSQRRHSHHSWARGSINDVLIPIESYHLFDPFGRRVKHDTRFDYDRIPAIVELCIQAGVDLPQYPSRRRTAPVRMIGKKVIDRGEFVDEPKPHRSEDCVSLLAELDTFSNQRGQSPSPSNVQELAERTLKAYLNVRRGVEQLMSKYTVKSCGYCSEVHVGPWGHNVKLCGAFKHQWRDGKHGWQDAVVDEVIPPNYVWHVPDPSGPPLRSSLRSFYGKAPAVVELCVQAGAEIPDEYRPMMRTDIVIPDSEEARMAA